jgi:hypothetical protein
VIKPVDDEVTHSSSHETPPLPDPSGGARSAPGPRAAWRAHNGRACFRGRTKPVRRPLLIYTWRVRSSAAQLARWRDTVQTGDGLRSTSQ